MFEYLRARRVGEVWKVYAVDVIVRPTIKMRRQSVIKFEGEKG